MAKASVSYHTSDVKRPTATAGHQSRNVAQVLRCWAWELAALFTAVALQVAIILILVVYNDRETPKWRYGINISTLVALLSTFLRAAVVSVLASVISQAKWSWFTEKKRAASDIQTYDDASRGVPGSVVLLWLLRLGTRGSGSLIASMAALMTILSLGTAPFAQQAITTVSCDRVSSQGAGRLPVSNALPGAGGLIPYGTRPIGDVAMDLKAAMTNGFANPFGDDSTVQASCPTGNCTFSGPNDIPLSTAGICSKCIDLSDLIVVNKSGSDGDTLNFENQDERFPDSMMSIRTFVRGPQLAAGPGPIIDDDDLPQEYREVAAHAIVNTTILTLTGAPCESHNCSEVARNWAHATRCSLYGCKQDFKAKVQNGVLEEELLDTQPLPYDPSSDAFTTPFPFLAKSPCVIDDQIYDFGNFSLVPNNTRRRTFVDVPQGRENVSVPTDCVYGIHFKLMEALRVSFDDMIQRNCSFQISPEPGNCLPNWWMTVFYHNGNATHELIKEDFGNFARVLTNYFRRNGLGAINTTDFLDETYRQERGPGGVDGQVWESTICVQLYWPWLLYSSILCLVTAVLLFTMVIISYRDEKHPLWKSSVLPLLFYSFVDSRQPPVPEGLQDRELSAAASTTFVSLDAADKHSPSNDPATVRRIPYSREGFF